MPKYTIRVANRNGGNAISTFLATGGERWKAEITTDRGAGWESQINDGRDPRLISRLGE